MLNWKSRSSHDCLRSFSVPKVISHSQSTVYIELNLRLKNQFQKIKQSEVLTLIECEHNDGKIKTALSYLVISPAIFGSPKIFPRMLVHDSRTRAGILLDLSKTKKSTLTEGLTAHLTKTSPSLTFISSYHIAGTWA